MENTCDYVRPMALTEMPNTTVHFTVAGDWDSWKYGRTDNNSIIPKVPWNPYNPFPEFPYPTYPYRKYPEREWPKHLDIYPWFPYTRPITTPDLPVGAKKSNIEDTIKKLEELEKKEEEKVKATQTVKDFMDKSNPKKYVIQKVKHPSQYVAGENFEVADKRSAWVFDTKIEAAIYGVKNCGKLVELCDWFISEIDQTGHVFFMKSTLAYDVLEVFDEEIKNAV